MMQHMINDLYMLFFPHSFQNPETSPSPLLPTLEEETSSLAANIEDEYEGIMVGLCTGMS